MGQLQHIDQENSSRQQFHAHPSVWDPKIPLYYSRMNIGQRNSTKVHEPCSKTVQNIIQFTQPKQIIPFIWTSTSHYTVYYSTQAHYSIFRANQCTHTLHNRINQSTSYYTVYSTQVPSTFTVFLGPVHAHSKSGGMFRWSMPLDRVPMGINHTPKISFTGQLWHQPRQQKEQGFYAHPWVEDPKIDQRNTKPEHMTMLWEKLDAYINTLLLCGSITFTLEPILQCRPMADRFTLHLSPSWEPSPSMQCGPT